MEQFLSKDDICAFLYFGYIPKLTENTYRPPWNIEQVTDNQKTLASLTESQLIDEGVVILQDSFNNISNGDHIVPLSGGLDSRAILGGLIETGLRDQITTVTFGTPGTFDYDIGVHIAKKMNVRFETIDLTKIIVNENQLMETAEDLGECFWIFDAFYNRQIPKKFGSGAIYWSGFLGDPLAGSHLPKIEHASWKEVKKHFMEHGKFVKSIDLTPPEYRMDSRIPNVPLLSNSPLCYEELLDFSVRQDFYIKKIILISNFNYQAPFLNDGWVNFILNIPKRYRKNEYLYKKILMRAYPELFRLPVKDNFGLPLNAPYLKNIVHKAINNTQSFCSKCLPGVFTGESPMINYIDFNKALRSKKDLKNIVYNNVQDLAKRHLIDWVDIINIWGLHQKGKGNYADALTLLTSLEIYLKYLEKSAIHQN